ncbi:hypothetical protein LOZ35_003769 [Ophidiomyces ophidiicola]|nr:hypothetical protein LOZ35_003769 [Ophidiomyces ophidiicola]
MPVQDADHNHHDPDDDLSADPRDFYLHYHDPFAADRPGLASSPSDPARCRSASASRPRPFRSGSAATPPAPAGPRHRQSSLKELVDRFNHARDEVPPQPCSHASLAAVAAVSAKPYTRPLSRAAALPEPSWPSTHRSPSSKTPAPTKDLASNDPMQPTAARKPLFGEILPLDTFVGHQERRRASHRRRGSDSCMPSPGPMFLDIPFDLTPAWSPSSPTAWYLGYNTSSSTTTPPNPPLLHRRSRSDLGVNGSPPLAVTIKHPPPPTAPAAPGSPQAKSRSHSRIPVSTRRHSQTSDSGNSSPSTRTNSALDRHPANVSLPRKGASALPKPAPKRRTNSPISPRITSPARRNNLPPLKSPTLNAIITAPPPKESPPLRSSRPRLPVSTATTSASRAKVVDRISDFQNNNNNSNMALKSPRSSRAKSRRLPELGNVDFAARRQRIQQAFNRSIEESNKKEIAKRAQRAARLKETEKQSRLQGDEEKSEHREPPAAVAEKVVRDDDHNDDQAPQASDVGEDQEAFVTADEQSPGFDKPTEKPFFHDDSENKALTESTCTETLDIPIARLNARPSSVCSDVAPASAVTDTTTIDMEPQTDFPQPTASHRTMLSHIMQMRESSPDITDTSDDDEEDSSSSSSSSGRDKESIQIMLRQTYFDPVDTSSENQEYAEEEDADHDRRSSSLAERQRWSMSSWSSSIHLHSNNSEELGSAAAAKAEALPHDDHHDNHSVCAGGERVTTPQPAQGPGERELTGSASSSKVVQDASPESQKQTPRSGERFSLNLMHRYPDLAKQAKWDTKRATQLYLQELAKAGFAQPRIPEPTAISTTPTTTTTTKKVEDEKNADDGGLGGDAVMLPESKSIPPAEYIPQLANLNLRDDWERASPSIADWMHLAATEKETQQHQQRDAALTPRISTSTPRLRDLSTNIDAGSGLGVSILIQSPQDGDSPTIPELPTYPPPPPPVELDAQKEDSPEMLHPVPLLQASPSIYSQDASPDMLPTISFVPKDIDTDARTSNGSSFDQTLTSGIVDPTRASQELTADAPGQHLEAPSPMKTPTPEQRRLKKRLLVIKELIDTEYTFGQDMTVVVDIYKGTSSSCGLTPEDVKILFSNSEQVVKFSMDFQDALKQAAKSVYVLPKSQRWLSKRASKYVPNASNSGSPGGSSVQENPEVSDDEKDRQTTVGQTFIELSTRMEKVYSEYLKNHDAANKTLDTLLKNKNKHVNIWLKECRDWASDLTTAWSLDSLLVKPVQRVLKYPLLLTELLSTTPTDHPDHAALADALRETTAMSVRINDMKKRADVVGQVVGSRKRKESDVRAGLSKAFGRRTEKLKQHVGLSEMFTDKEYDALAQRFGDNFFQLQLVMRDVELYTTEMQTATARFHEFVVAIEAYMTVAPSNYPEIESKWCRFRLAAKDVVAVALVDHLAAVRKSVIAPMVTLLKLHDGPQRVMQKRNKRLLDYVKYKAIKDRGDRPDKKLTELGEQFVALNVTLKEELPRLLALTGRLMEACLNSFVQLQTGWHALVQKRLGFALDRLPPDVAAILSDWAGDFTFSEAQVLSLGVCNGAVLADIANVHGSEQPAAATSSSSLPSRRPSSTAARTFSVEYGASPKTSVDFAAAAGLPAYPADALHTSSGRSRASSNFSSSAYITPAAAAAAAAAAATASGIIHTTPSSSRNSTAAISSSAAASSYRTSDASPLLPQLSLDTPRFPEFFPDPLVPLNTPTHVPPDLADHPSSPDAPRYSGFFSSAMPMAETTTTTTAPSSTSMPSALQQHQQQQQQPLSPPPPPPTVVKEPKVLFLAASMYEFNIDRARREAGYPYLTYVAGEIFDVIGEKGDLWLARNQDDPTHQVGWIWLRHFAKLAG